MTAAALPLASSRTPTSPLAWTGRILSGVTGGFLALDGVSRMVLSRALVPPSEAAPTLEPSLQIPVAGVLMLGAALYGLRPARLFGAGLLLLGLVMLISVEAAANVRSATHMLFWAYVGALVVAGLALRRSPAPSKEPS